MKRVLIVAGLLIGLTACDAGSKAAASKPATAAQAAQSTTADTAAVADAYARPPRRDEPVRQVAGKPIWSSNRQASAEENARSHFQRDGADFDAKTEDDYVAKAHAFTSHPPRGAKTLKRPNGDTLIYDQKSNTFAVMTREGAPRTMFKPRKGPDYWEEQVRRESEKSGRERN
jgi:pyocin large subunit-like protein